MNKPNTTKTTTDTETEEEPADIVTPGAFGVAPTDPSSAIPPALEDIIPGTTIRTANGESIFVPATDAQTISDIEESIPTSPWKT